MPRNPLLICLCPHHVVLTRLCRMCTSHLGRLMKSSIRRHLTEATNVEYHYAKCTSVFTAPRLSRWKASCVLYSSCWTCPSWRERESLDLRSIRGALERQWQLKNSISRQGKSSWFCIVYY